MAPVSQTSPASRWTVIFASAATVILTSGAGYVTSSWLADRATARSEQISEVNRFIRSTEAFEPLVRTHMSNVLDQKSTDRSEEALLKNVQEQHVLLDSVGPLLPSDLRSRGDEYGAVLVKLAPAIENADDVLTAGPLMQQANNAVVKKRRLISGLREATGLTR